MARQSQDYLFSSVFSILFILFLTTTFTDPIAYAGEEESDSSWSWYTQLDTQISLKFPTDWMYEEFEWNNSDFTEFDYLTRFYTTNGELISLLIWKDIDQVSSEEWIIETQKRVAYETDPKVEKVTISGKLTYWYVSVGGSRYPTSLYVHFTNGRYGYRLHYIASNAGKSLDSIYNLIASITFANEDVQNVQSSQVSNPEQINSFLDRQLYIQFSDVQSIEANTSIIDPTFNRYPYGQCTWWAAYSRPDIPMSYDEWPSNAHGGYWDDRAREHPDFDVSATPSDGALAVWEPDSDNSYGHVAYVTKVHADGTFDVTEMNYGSCWGKTTVCARERISAAGVSFIPAAVTIFEKSNFGGDWQRYRTNIPSVQFGDGISSIYIPPNWDIIAYEASEYQGAWFERLGRAGLSSSLQDLSDYNFTNSSNMDNRIRSLKIGHQVCLVPLRRQTSNVSCQTPMKPIPLPPAPQPTTPPNNPSCNATQPGVILYSNPDYKGICTRFLEGQHDLSNILNDTVASIRINGNYRVTLYKDEGLGGSSNELNESNSHLVVRSWSSIKIESKARESSCGDGSRNGVYFYRDKDYRGDCLYTTGDIKDFAYTKIGNNKVSSARIVGNWEVAVYDSQKFKGRSYTFTESKGNLDDKADIGSDISSAQIRIKNKPAKPPYDCPPPILLQPSNGAMVGQRNITFKWSGISCNRTDITESYRLRISTTPNTSSGGETVVDQLVVGAGHEIAIDARWHRVPLYWAVQVGNARNGAQWSNAYLLKVDPNLPPTVTVQQANEQAITANEQFVWGNVTNWAVSGSASDTDGAVTSVTVACTGQSCNETSPANLNGNSWSYQRDGLEGRNHLAVQAVDNVGAVSNRDNLANLTLWVDRAAPQTGLVLNGNSNPANWPQWFTEPVVAQLAASDVGSGSGANLARAGVKELRYRLDGGEWQTQSGDQLYLELTTSGGHTLDYYAVDNVGNSEAQRSQLISLDLTPPIPPGAASEVGGVINDQWQKNNHRPTFAWGAASDEHAGLWGYQLYFGVDPAGEGYHTVRANEPLTWTPHETGVTSGVYYLRGRTRDQAGNWSAWATLFTFKYDNTPPANPTSARHAAAITDGVWQRITSSATFTWTPAVDDGAGVQGYSIYWGADPNGTSADLLTLPSYQSPAPLCAAGQTCTGYLRLRARDLAGNEAPSWSTAFTLRHDDTPPTLDFAINGGASETNATQVTLAIKAADTGSGPAQMRFSADGANWVNWITYATSYPWTISGISGQSSTVYMQVRDGVGLESLVVQRSIRFEANIPQPSSARFALFNSTFAAGGGEQLSNNFWLHSTVAEPPDSAPLVSARFVLVEGYEAGGVAAPTFTPPPPPPIQPACSTPPLLINEGSAFTSVRQVLLRFCAVNAVAMQVSDNVGFNGAHWEPFVITKTFTLAQPTAPVTPLYAYVRFRLADGSEQGAYADFIYYDAVQPVAPKIYIGDPIAGLLPAPTVRAATSAPDSRHPLLIGPQGLVQQLGSRGNLVAAEQVIAAAAVNTGPLIDIYIDNQDDLAGISAIQLSEQADFAGATWQAVPTTNLVTWALPAEDGNKTLYARAQDKAGNISSAAYTTYTLDLTPPTGGIGLEPYVVGVNTEQVHIYLAADDNLSGVTDMRISTDPLLLLGDVWRPYTLSLTIPAYLPLAGELPLYVQFRDAAGNVSSVYSDTYQVDVEPPQIEVEVAPGDTLTRRLTLYGYDGLSDITWLRFSNDLAGLQQVTPLPYTGEITWTFDERNVVWVQAEDSLGNVSDPMPVYAAATLTMQDLFLPIIQR